ncbi:unnamed protein product [Amoebophrya sp. A25]|nr:unnamed protein product [Amoebophrya sp. A25]|eukprot:GSA25T00022909001.1
MSAISKSYLRGAAIVSGNFTTGIDTTMPPVSFLRTREKAAKPEKQKPVFAPRPRIPANFNVEVKSGEDADKELETLTTFMATQEDTVKKLEAHFNNKDKIDPYGPEGHEIKWSQKTLKRYIAQEIWGNIKGHMLNCGTKNIGDPKSPEAKAGRLLWEQSSIGVAMVTNGWKSDDALEVVHDGARIDKLELLSASSLHPLITSSGSGAESKAKVDPATAVETIAFGVGCDGAYVSTGVTVTSFEFGDILLRQTDVQGAFPGEKGEKALALFKMVQGWSGSLSTSWDSLAAAFDGTWWNNLIPGEGDVPGMFGKGQKDIVNKVLSLPPFVARPWLQSDHLPATLYAELPTVGGYERPPIVKLLNWNILGRGLVRMTMPSVTILGKKVENIQAFFQLIALRKKVGEMANEVDTDEVDISVLAFQEDLFVQTKDTDTKTTTVYDGYWTKIFEEHGYTPAFLPQKSWHDGLPEGDKRLAVAELTLDKATPYVIASTFSPSRTEQGETESLTGSPEFDGETQELVMGNTVYIKLSKKFKGNAGCEPMVAQSGWNDPQKTHAMYQGFDKVPFRSLAIGFVYCSVDNTIVAAFPVGHLAGGKFDDNEIFDGVLKGFGADENLKEEMRKHKGSRGTPWKRALDDFKNNENNDEKTKEKKMANLPTTEGGELYYQGAGNLVRTMVKAFVQKVYEAAAELTLPNGGKLMTDGKTPIPLILPMDMNTKPDMRYFLDEAKKALGGAKAISEAVAKVETHGPDKSVLLAQRTAIKQFKLEKEEQDQNEAKPPTE